MDNHGHVRVQSDEPEYYLDNVIGYRGYTHLENARLSTVVPGSKDRSSDQYYECDATPDDMVYDWLLQQDCAAPEDHLDEQHHPDEVRGYPSSLQTKSSKSDRQSRLNLSTDTRFSTLDAISLRELFALVREPDFSRTCLCGSHPSAESFAS
jgi:hypothetical protein